MSLKKQKLLVNNQAGQVTEVLLVPQVIDRPHITEKASFLSSFNQYVFKVLALSNKVQIRKAIENMYKVHVIAVRIIHVPSKKRQIGRFQGQKPGFKKAIVSLQAGQTIDVNVFK